MCFACTTAIYLNIFLPGVVCWGGGGGGGGGIDVLVISKVLSESVRTRHS